MATMHEIGQATFTRRKQHASREHVAPASRLEEDLRSYYVDAEDENIFEKWERGEARGDSTTPSICSPEYRAWMLDQLRGLMGNDTERRLLSIGAGNAMVERTLCREGYHVLAVDALMAAVEIAARNGVPSICRDIRSWEPQDRFDVVYADGLLGHLYDEFGGCQSVWRRVRGWLSSHEGAVIVSNDVPPGDAPVKPAPGVTGFYWLSTDWIAEMLVEAGFTPTLRTEFVYERPLSGPRRRAIIAATPS
jgi:2-polyprenyl-3-methyl-5-hydroxy-6-metoxy-1,4-benzoquinol methylase